jgi:hypothetical protein
VNKLENKRREVSSRPPKKSGLNKKQQDEEESDEGGDEFKAGIRALEQAISYPKEIQGGDEWE